MRLPYRYRGIIWACFLVVALPWIIWKFTLQDTISMWYDSRRMTHIISNLSLIDSIQLQPKLADRSEIVLSGAILDSLQKYTVQQCQIIEYIPGLTICHEYIELHTAQLTLTGNYNNLLLLLQHFERQLPSCRLCSIEWFCTNVSYSTDKQLYLTIYIQQLVQRNQ